MNLPKPPQFFLGAVIIFWGWQTGYLMFALPMAVLIESVPWVRWRWDFNDDEFNLLVDLTAILWIGAGVYFWLQTSYGFILELIAALPMLSWVLLAAQHFSKQQDIAVSSLVYARRRRRKRSEEDEQEQIAQRVDITYAYIILTLMSTSMGRQPGMWAELFFVCFVLLCGWGLWHLRSARFSQTIWLSMMLVVAASAWAGHAGWRYAQNSMERMFLSWLDERFWHYRDPFRQQTAIGELGRLKNSNRILFRVKSEQPMLLQQAAYDKYSGASWRISYTLKFEEVEAPVEGVWQFGERQHPHETVEVHLPLVRGRAVLPLPAGTFQVEGVAGPKVQRNPYGAVKIDEGPGLFTYTARFGDDIEPRGAERLDNSTRLNNTESGTIQRYAKKLGLLDPNKSPREKIQRVEQFFQNGFTYSLDLRRYDNGKTPLADFLDTIRSGHCEYYATTTALLLRSAGIPARYTVGFSVQEYSVLEQAYVVRRRHAHAWVSVYIDGQWQTVDTTPAIWGEYEAEAAASWWRPVGDLFSWLGYRFDLWRWSEDEEVLPDSWLLWLLAPLVVLLIWRLSRQKRVDNDEEDFIMPEDPDYPGLDSAFYQILQRLEQGEFEQRDGEPLRWWLHRLETEAPDVAERLPLTQLRRLLTLHNRYRFDPRGISDVEKTELRQTVATCLAWLEQNTVPSA